LPAGFRDPTLIKNVFLASVIRSKEEKDGIAIKKRNPMKKSSGTTSEMLKSTSKGF